MKSSNIAQPRFLAIEDDNDTHVDLKAKLENPNRIRRHTKPARSPLLKAKKQLSDAQVHCMSQSLDKIVENLCENEVSY